MFNYRDLPNWKLLRSPEELIGRSEASTSVEVWANKESHLLRTKLGGHRIQGQETLGDSNQLKSLALLQESMVRE